MITRYKALLMLITGGVVLNVSVISGTAARMLVVDMEATRPQQATTKVIELFWAWVNLA